MSDESVPHCARYDSIDALLIGAGRGGIAIMELFQRYKWLHLKGVVDKHEFAPGMQIAQTLAIPVFTDVDKALNEFDGDIIIDVTGDHTLSSHLPEMRRNRNIEIVSGKTAKILFDMVEDQIHDQEIISSKTSQLQLIKTMLQISEELKKRHGEESILTEGMQGSAMLIVSHKAIALECNGPDIELIGGLGVDGVNDIQIDWNINYILDAIQQSRKADDRLIELATPLEFPGIEGKFQLTAPFYINHELRYLLIFEVQLPLTEDTHASLTMLLSHLQLAMEAENHHKLLQELAYRDPLTGVYNRRFFDERLHQELDRLRRSSCGNIALMFLDLDHFKQMNDTHGHVAGDRVLRNVATAIHSTLRSYDVLARYGGDEFIAILTGFQMDDIQPIAKRVLAAVKNCQVTDIDFDDKPVQVGISIGIAIAIAGSEIDDKRLIEYADQALYAAKQSGRGQIHITKCAGENAGQRDQQRAY